MADACVDVHLVMAPGMTSLTESVSAVLAHFMAIPRPQFGSTDDEELSRFWLVRVAADDSPTLIQALLATPGVDGAYSVPAEEPA